MAESYAFLRSPGWVSWHRVAWICAGVGWVLSRAACCGFPCFLGRGFRSVPLLVRRVRSLMVVRLGGVASFSLPDAWSMTAPGGGVSSPPLNGFSAGLSVVAFPVSLSGGFRSVPSARCPVGLRQVKSLTRRSRRARPVCFFQVSWALAGFVPFSGSPVAAPSELWR